MADVAIVGSGPVGLKLALDLADAGLEVLLIESGTESDNATAQALSDAEIADPKRQAPMSLAVRRGLGGTSHLWGGRAVAFDDVDFMPRPGFEHARWPIGASDVAPWYETACRFLDCGPAEFSKAWPGQPATPGVLLDRLERWCAHPDMQRAHGARVAAHPRIRLLLNTTVQKVLVSQDGGHVTSLVARTGDETQMLLARSYVVAAGGIETARLLLESRAERPLLFGGPDRALGRFYMGHIYGVIADIQFLRRGDDAQFEFHKDAAGRYIRRRITLDGPTQTADQLLNLTLCPDLPELFDARHRSAILSLAYLALATPVLGQRLMSEGIRRRKLGDGPVRPLPHLWNVLRGAPAAGLFAGCFLWARYAGDVRLPGFFVRNASNRYALFYHGEQMPKADSRITLADARDDYGMRRARVDLRFDARDAQSVVASHDAIGERLAAAGLARIEHRHAVEEREAAVLAQASDGFHQIGTARMAADPRQGVVDADARVHGLSNLFLAGSAIFPTSGQANPTLLAVALAARLAAHLKTALPAMDQAAVALAG